MAQVLAMDLLHGEFLSPPRSKRDSVASSGRGGSGNIRPLFIFTNVDPLHRAAKRAQAQSQTQFTSSGRGGSGNIQLSTSPSNLQAHPLTASILSQHKAMEAQYEERVRKVHAEANVIRSSGRGGSGNISNPRRKSASQSEPRSKKHLFSTKGKERDMNGANGAQAHGAETSSMDKRTSRATFSSGNCSDLCTIYSYSTSNESRVSHAVASSASAMSDPALDEGATAQPRHRRTLRWSRTSSSSGGSLFSHRWSRSSPSVVSTPPPSIQAGSPTSIKIHSSGPAILEDDGEYVSFLDL